MNIIVRIMYWINHYIRHLNTLYQFMLQLLVLAFNHYNLRVL